MMSSAINEKLARLLEIGNSPLERLSSEILAQKNILLYIKRDDLLYFPEFPEFCGNKVRKMKYNLIQAIEQNKDTLLTFGGAFSNHIAATAAAGKLFGLKTIGIIRGEEVLPLNPTLKRAQENGMQFQFISRVDYRKKHTVPFIHDLKNKWGDFYLIPEGGSNMLAIKGCRELGEEIKEQLKGETIDYIASSCGTGGTFTGLITAFDSTTDAIGYPALKGDFMDNEVKQFLNQYTAVTTANWSTNNQYHFGGFARYKPELITFMKDFYNTFNILLDPLYTGKLFYGIFDQIKTDYFSEEKIIVAVHSGGLQGLKGFNARYGLDLPL